MAYTRLGDFDYQGTRYALYVDPVNVAWTDAQAFAESIGGHLATFTSADENNTIGGWASNFPTAWVSIGTANIGPWIGGFESSEGIWNWVTDEPWDYANWAYLEPNNLTGPETHLHIFSKDGSASTNATWGDIQEAGYMNATDNVRSFLVERADSVGPLSQPEALTVAYLYEAVLDRDGDIDPAGLNFWIAQRESGLDEVQTAQFFLDSPEFREGFGDPAAFDNRGFVELLYENVLDRAGDEAGVNFWSGVIAGGASRAETLIFFVDSPENVENLDLGGELTRGEDGMWDFV